MTVDAGASGAPSGRASLPMFGARHWRVVERNFLVYRRGWVVFVTGMLEPILYLLSIGIGVGGLVGDFTLRRRHHRRATSSSWRRRCWPPRP